MSDITVQHAYILMNLYGPQFEYYNSRPLQPQYWIRTQKELDACMELVELGLARSFNGIFYRTWKGQHEIDKLYGRKTVMP